MIAATEIGFVRMRVSKVVGLNDGDHVCEFVVLNELDRGRPMTYQFMAELVRSLGGRIREIRLDGLVSGAYGATVEAVLVGAPIVVALEMVEDSDQRQEGESAETVLMRRALTAPPMTITKAER
jgi:bifunctional DNase/RNase